VAHDPVSLTAQVGVDLDDFALEVTLAVAAGRTTAVVGPNGAGKTTLLRALAGLRALSRGRIDLDGAVLDDPAAGTYVPPERRPVGVVFQDNLLFPHLDARDNVAFGLRSRGQRRAAARATAGEWLERVGLAGRERARPAELSGGQAQRVALARALAVEPALLLLDEPLAALDVTTRNEVRREIRRHLDTFAGVRVLVTHDPLDAALLADEMVVLDGGRVAQTGTPAEITARPRSRWVADLAGINLFSGTVGGDGAITVDGGGSLVVADHGHRGPVFAVVPPRAVALHHDRPAGSARNVWQGRVVAVEPFGDRLRIRVDGTPPVVAEVTAGGGRDLGLGDGVGVWISVKATEIDVYPA
jgi:molybdate transport system ATP-binding protein